ncbi:hypothetical protein IJG22_01090, partial [Candidatus Saccharibacteria bacterium]|nr:hypothetical protein [Candidatus Saccharibacteria bacterium]
SVAEGTNVNYTKDYIVEDERDNKYYIVRKLYMRASDGTISTACWMTQNLDLDLVAQYNGGGENIYILWYNRENNTAEKLTESNSDIASRFKMSSSVDNNMIYAATGGENSASQDWTTSYKFGPFAYGVAPSFPTATTANLVLTPSGSTNTNNDPGVLDPGDILFGPFDKDLSLYYAEIRGTNACEAADIRCYQFRNARYFATESSGHVVSDNANGNYYNWYAATAGTGNTNLATDNVAPDSICPKEWRLPIGGKGEDNGNEYARLMGAYYPTAGSQKQNGENYRLGDNYTGFGSLYPLKTNSDSIFTDIPLSFTRSENASYALKSNSNGLNGRYWTSYSANPHARALLFGSASLYPGVVTDVVGSGRSVRCIQK